VGSFLPALEAFWAGQPDKWLPAPLVSLPLLLPITRFSFPKGVDLDLLNMAIRARIGSRLLPLLVATALCLLFKVATLLSSPCPCYRRAAFRAVSS
jgi:hypothetical protein